MPASEWNGGRWSADPFGCGPVVVAAEDADDPAPGGVPSENGV